MRPPMRVYILQHERDIEGSSDVKMIGVYRTEQDALAARKRLSAAPGFRDHPDGFSIDPYELDQDHLTEGFVSVPVGSDGAGKQTQAA
jgi:hypothetical protein